MTDLLVSVHVPKTAGTSFRAALHGAFGAGLRLDYHHERAAARLHAKGVDPVDLHRRWLDLGPARATAKYFAGPAFAGSRVACIHGHFPAVKYLPAVLHRRVRFITWLRHPFRRMVSNYRFWHAQDRSKVVDPFVHHVLDDGWSLGRFCLSPSLRNYQSAFFKGFPMSRLAFVGVVEHYDSDLRWLAESVLGRDLGSVRLNETRGDAGMDEAGELDDLQRRFEAYHDLDMAFYRRALALRARRTPVLGARDA
ncbi:MAG TPA: hypothetical protein VJ994_01655 [Paracoccaceae bacterium]|nr:hypothetical protein [Paracoccaceae bacterium]